MKILKGVRNHEEIISSQKGGKGRDPASRGCPGLLQLEAAQGRRAGGGGGTPVGRLGSEPRQALPSGLPACVFMEREVRVSESEELGEPVRIMRGVKKGKNTHCGGWESRLTAVTARKEVQFPLSFTPTNTPCCVPRWIRRFLSSSCPLGTRPQIVHVMQTWLMRRQEEAERTVEEGTCTYGEGSLGVGGGHGRVPGGGDIQVTGNRAVRVSQTEPQKGGGAGWAWETPQHFSTLRPVRTHLFPFLCSPLWLSEATWPPQSRRLQPQITEKTESSRTLEKHQLPVQWNYLLCPMVAALSSWGAITTKPA